MHKQKKCKATTDIYRCDYGTLDLKIWIGLHHLTSQMLNENEHKMMFDVEKRNSTINAHCYE